MKDIEIKIKNMMKRKGHLFFFGSIAAKLDPNVSSTKS